MKKTLITILATVLICCCVAGGTLAWLVDKTDDVVNTFTVGDISITLTEEAKPASDKAGTDEIEFKMIPGSAYAKDPKVTVEADSEKCYLFVKVTEANNDSNLIVWSVRTGTGEWQALPDVANVYYRVVDVSAADQSFYVLTGSIDNPNGEVTVSENLQKGETAIPSLTFTAYAVQYDNMANANDAWTKGNF